MDRIEISDIAHTHHRIAAPVSPQNVRVLLSRLAIGSGGRALDLGCGAGEWLTELLHERPGVTGVGVDRALPDDVASRAAARGVADRVSWVEADAASWTGGLHDVVLCVGASHAFGGLAGTLDGVRRHLRPGGQVLLGDAIWEVPPSARAQEVLEAGPDDFPDLAGLVSAVRGRGFEPGYGHVSTAEEWDDYEWSWTGSLAEWGLRDAPDAEAREQALAAAREHRDDWLSGYRNELGFVTLVLNDVAAHAATPGALGDGTA